MDVKTRTFPRLLALCTAIVAVGAYTLAHAQYVDPKRSSRDRDLTEIRSGLFGTGKVPYEYQTNGTLSVGYSLVRESVGGDSLRLTLVFRNTGTEPLTVVPTVSMMDGDGFLFEPQTYDELSSRAERLAATPLPSSPPTTPSTITTTGTIRNRTTGETSQIDTQTSGSSGVPGIGGAAIEGAARGQAAFEEKIAFDQRRQGGELVQWLPQHYLKEHYSLPAGTASFGALLFPSRGKPKLPISVSVRVGDKQFTFRSHYD